MYCNIVQESVFWPFFCSLLMDPFDASFTLQNPHSHSVFKNKKKISHYILIVKYHRNYIKIVIAIFCVLQNYSQFIADEFNQLNHIGALVQNFCSSRCVCNNSTAFNIREVLQYGLAQCFSTLFMLLLSFISPHDFCLFFSDLTATKERRLCLWQ